jgi:hypothetical protein
MKLFFHWNTICTANINIITQWDRPSELTPLPITMSATLNMHVAHVHACVCVCVCVCACACMCVCMYIPTYIMYVTKARQLMIITMLLSWPAFHTYKVFARQLINLHKTMTVRQWFEAIVTHQDCRHTLLRYNTCLAFHNLSYDW